MLPTKISEVLVTLYNLPANIQARRELTQNLRQVKAIFFDCDNTLVDTESVAAEAASTVINKVLADQGILVRFDNMQLFTLYFGKTARQMITELQKEYNFTLTKEQVAAYTTFEEDLVVDLLYRNPLPCEGIKEILQTLHDARDYKLAVVSSSPIRRIRAALTAAGISQFFHHDNVFSAKSSMPTPKSKPDPAIYQWAMDKNGVTAEQCIAFEDSRSGARSSINAGIRTVAYVGAYSVKAQQDQVAEDLQKEGCKVVMRHYDELQAMLKQVVRE